MYCGELLRESISLLPTVYLFPVLLYSSWEQKFIFGNSVTLGPYKIIRGVFLFLTKITFPALKKNVSYRFAQHGTELRFGMLFIIVQNLEIFWRGFFFIVPVHWFRWVIDQVGPYIIYPDMWFYEEIYFSFLTKITFPALKKNSLCI